MAKQRFRLTKEQAEHINIDIKPNEDGRNTARYYLNSEQVSSLGLPAKPNKRKFINTQKKLNKDGEVLSTIEKLQSEPIEVPENFEIIKISTSETTGQQWIQYAPKKNNPIENTISNLEAVVEELKKEIKPTKIIKAPTKSKGIDLCNQYTLTDYHLGMMCWYEETGGNWDMKIAEDTLVSFFKIAMDRSPDANEAIFAQIGDFLHWDGLDAVTPQSKHVLDADTRFTKVVRVAIRVIRRVINMLLNKYQHVTVIMAEGNHDPASSVWLREMLHSFYDYENRITIDTNPDPYYCVTWGKCCLFYHHGHKRNATNIDTVFVSKFRKEYGNSSFIYGHLGHLHHQKTNETNLMIVEQHRTLAAKDAYATRGGYGSGRDGKVITYHKDFGEVGRSIIGIKLIESLAI